VFSQTNDEITIGQKVHFDSEVYGTSRELFISLPSDYNDTLKKHPVLYVLFPKWSFERAKSAAGYLEGYHGFPGLILVGLCNEDDWGEVFPFQVDRIPTSGGGKKFLNFISTEAIPFVESNYRTDSLRILAGFSNSAMFATYAMIHESDLFHSFILSSPMLGWGENYVLNESIDFFNSIQSFDRTLYVIYGDDDYTSVKTTMPEFEKLLQDKAPENLDWKIDLLKNEGHVPYADVYNGLVYTFKKLKAKSIEKLFSDLKGDYFGQTPPGDTPVVFAPGIISADSTIEHGAPSFSPDGNEVFWQSNYRQSGKETQISSLTMRRNKNKWTTPEISSYGNGPVFSPDGKRLYFNSKEKKGTIFYIEKEGEKWSDPKNLDLIDRFPDLKFAYNLSFTNNGTLYFLGYAEELETMNKYGIYRSELIDGTYAKPELLPSNINMEEGLLNWTPFIAPDESYLLFSSSRHTAENDYGDIYISFSNAEGTWTDPVKLSNGVNSDRQERFPAISPDGKYLFFTRWITRSNEDVFWVSAKIIEDLKKEVFNPKTNSNNENY
jgi:predicted alpha/beta superfamily hydrolase